MTMAAEAVVTTWRRVRILIVLYSLPNDPDRIQFNRIQTVDIEGLEEV